MAIPEKPEVYVETSVISYLTARPSNNLRAATWQNITTEWWQLQRHRFTLYVSEFVVAEASLGHPEAATKRISAIHNIKQLSANEAVRNLADRLLINMAFPKKAEVDALRVAIAAVHQIDYLLTWNCTHIANAVMRPRIENIYQEQGLSSPVICTPFELM
ncbi:MAG: type II toxin-antitoxin system VapC family toxin [Pseudomonadota bacterium]